MRYTLIYNFLLRVHTRDARAAGRQAGRQSLLRRTQCRALARARKRVCVGCCLCVFAVCRSARREKLVLCERFDLSGLIFWWLIVAFVRVLFLARPVEVGGGEVQAVLLLAGGGGFGGGRRFRSCWFDLFTCVCLSGCLSGCAWWDDNSRTAMIADWWLKPRARIRRGTGALSARKFANVFFSLLLLLLLLLLQ